jgi:ATPase subunit of ABC transporter with duplicated ATPase domains
MSAAITLSDITWATPEGRTLFSHLNLCFNTERIGVVGRNGTGKTTLFRLITGELRPLSGTVSVAGSVGILRQVVQVGKEETIADLFGVADGLALLRRIDQGTASDEDFEDVDWTLEPRMTAALGRMGLEQDPLARLATLSGGQRTRAGLAALAFAEPDFILLDEPTNNLDRAGRGMVIELLAKWRTGAVVISHDRELLETMDAIVELAQAGATRYGGNWSAYRERKELELEAARHDLADAEKRMAEVARTARVTAERKARKDGSGQRKNAKADTPRINLGRLKDRSEATSGGNARLFEKRAAQAQQTASAAQERIEILQPLSVVVPPVHLPSGKVVLALDKVTAGYTPGEPVLRDFSLTLTGPERVAVTGPNGSGKSTLLALITGALAPWTGEVLRATTHAMLDQRVDFMEPSASIRDNFMRLHPASDENACRAALARFMFRADAALQIVSSLSGGQLLRAGLSCVLGGEKPPPLLILDEPTNHLDIDSIEAIEAGLRAYDGALLVVSHDEMFLESIGITKRVEPGGWMR